jgi:hypothetical protein
VSLYDDAMNRGRRRWYSFLVDLAIKLARRRPDREETADRIRRSSFATDVSRWPLRMTAFVRDRLRRQWLRIRRD